MKKLFFIANWKANKNTQEMHSWFISFFSQSFIEYIHAEENTHDKKIIICPPFPILSDASEYLSRYKAKIPVSLGAQTIASIDSGAYTGEVTGHMLEGLVRYVLIGHSERRQMGETEVEIEKKVEQARAHNIEPILCVQSIHTPIPAGTHIVAYEPVESIGTGSPDTPEHANEVAEYFKEEKNILYVLYGGSVSKSNVHNFIKMEYLNGVLVGGASLDPDTFSDIVRKA